MTTEHVMVQLTPAGVKLANGNPLRFSSAHRSFSFEPGVAQSIEKSYDWTVALSPAHSAQGDKLFELAPSYVAQAAPAKPAPVVVQPATPTAPKET